MRLTIINQFYKPDLSPTAHLAASLAEHRAAQGDEVTVVTSLGGYVPASKDKQKSKRDNPYVHRVWTPQLGKGSVIRRCTDYGIFYLLTVFRLLVMPRQDVIISLTTPPYIAWAGVLHKLLHRGTKLVLWNMDCYPELAERSDKLKDHGFAARIMRVMNRALFARLDHLICLDTAMVDLLCPQYAPKDDRLRVTVIPNWEDATFFPPDADHPLWDEAEALGLNGRFVVLYLGNMGYGHRFETVIDAAEQLRDEPVTFLFIGGGSRWAVVEQAKAERKLDNIILHDYVPKEQTPSVMTGAHCALITLRDRILGVMSPSKLHSNLAMGLPVIYVGPATSNVDDAIRHYECGVSVRHGETEGVVAFIRKMMADSEGHGEMRRRARHAFDDAYNDRATLPKFDAVIGSLA